MGRRRGGGEPKCWICGEKGHVQTDCPSAASSSAAAPTGDDGAPAAAVAAPGGARRACLLCGSFEHLAASCSLSTKAADAEEQRRWPRVRRVVSSASDPAKCAGSCGARMSVLITTSPVPSNPSTMMLEAVLNSFPRVEGLEECPLVIVCDGYRFSGKSTWKAGKVTEDAAERYAEYLQNLERLLESGRLPAGTKLVILDGRNGQALAVQAGLREVETPLVLVHQHDLEFMFDFNLSRVLDVLQDDANHVRYVGLPLLVNLHYEACAWQHHGIRVAEEEHQGLRLVPVIFWYDSTHITSVEHYRSLIFRPEAPFRPGDFVEETFGVRQREDIMANGLAVHPKYGTYHCLSHAHDGSRRPLICHLNGVRFLTPEQRAERGYPADPPVDFFASRTMVNRKQRKVKFILDLIEGLSGVERDQSGKVRDLLAKELNDARLRSCASASAALPGAGPPAAARGAVVAAAAVAA